jgi:hypothetical protein
VHHRNIEQMSRANGRIIAKHDCCMFSQGICIELSQESQTAEVHAHQRQIAIKQSAGLAKQRSVATHDHCEVSSNFRHVQSKIHPGDPIDKNMYDLPPEEAAKVPQVCASLEEALQSLEKDHAFLTKGGVFSDEFLESYMTLKKEELTRFRMTTHPVEFDMYYSS